MTRTEAVRRLKKLYGDEAYWRVGQSQSSPERRAQAKAERDAAKARHEAAKQRVEEWLRAQPEYQALVAERRAAFEAMDRLQGAPHYYRFTIGKAEGIFAHVMANGDTWEECFAQVEQKAKAS